MFKTLLPDPKISKTPLTTLTEPWNLGSVNLARIDVIAGVSAPPSWQLPVDHPHVRINPAPNLDALQLPTHARSLILRAVQAILQSGLKLKAFSEEGLAGQLRDALALLLWLNH
jgi:hypothetical protein